MGSYAYSESFICSLLLLATLAVTAGRVSAQANIVENQSTYIYVDAKVGSDGNSGAQTAPFKTFQAGVNKAIALNQQNTGVKLILNSGVYRESVQIGNYKATRAPFTIQAAVTGGAVISGSDVVTGWTQQNSTTWQASFSDNTGFCAIPSGWPTTFAPIIQRTEMIFVNGAPLTQVMAYADLKPGTFFFSDAYQMLHIAPPAGTNMATAVVEAAVRPTTLTAIGRYNFVLRGLVFRHAANCMNTSSVNIFGSTQVLIDSVQAVWNNWAGLGVYTSNNFTVQNSVASYNGGAGILGDQDTYALYSFNQTDYNNWRGAQGAFYDWANDGHRERTRDGDKANDRCPAHPWPPNYETQCYDPSSTPCGCACRDVDGTPLAPICPRPMESSIGCGPNQAVGAGGTCDASPVVSGNRARRVSVRECPTRRRPAWISPLRCGCGGARPAQTLLFSATLEGATGPPGAPPHHRPGPPRSRRRHAATRWRVGSASGHEEPKHCYFREAPVSVSVL